MLAARLNLKKRELVLADVPVPEPGPGQVRVKVKAAGVCLSDVHLVDGTLAPLYLKGDHVTLGHEVAGVVDALGSKTREWAPGDRVALQAGETRDGVTYTRGVDYDGGWAEYALADVSTLVAIPDNLPYEQASIIPDAVSTPWAAVTSGGVAPPARPAGVWGAGGLGVHAVQLLRLIGAAPIIAVDPLPRARERALEFGADHAFAPDEPDLPAAVAAATGGAGLTVAFDFAGAPPVREQALACLAPAGTLVLVGLTDKPLTVADGTRFSYLRQHIRGHYGSQPADVHRLVDLTRLGRLELSGSVSDVLPLSQAPEAVRRLENKEGSPVRLILRP